ncbi:lysophospholipid acyltransferase family protein [Pararhodonellum marinum]|uniref:lysophospholipid acyltransferase family protein n=1 Tax=Pararhodonellum marinum TaxID=2755358 RepID=UPI00188E4964|nr:lysophospholipid acyltransferase family protein [Pararhodonellum marinum]
MRLVRRIYTLYVALLYLASFLLMFPFFLACIWIPGMKPYGRKINRLWAKVYFFLIFLPVKQVGRNHIQKNQPYIFVANHFSYLDIAMMGFVPGDVVFIGKSSIRKVPLFGYYFKNLHIALDRSSMRSRGEVLARAKKALDEGSSVVIFPEGGITSTRPPELSSFKNGAFSMAIEKQIPIIPITLSYNHLILPDDGALLMNFGKGKLVFHSPIMTEGLTVKDLPEIKSRCFSIIQEQLWRDNPDGNFPNILEKAV